MQMKKRAFIFLFVLVAIAFIYMPHQAQAVQQTDSCAKYNSNSCPSPQCQVQTTPSKKYCFWIICFPVSSSQKNCVTNLNSQGNNNDCSSNNGQNTLSDSKPTFSAEFFYEGVKTEGWKFSKIGSDARIFYPVLSSVTSNPPRTESITPNLEASNGDCKYYSFSYERPQQTLTYNLPAQSTTPTTVNGKPVCKYSMNPLISGQSKISLLAGQPIKDLSQICSELQKGKPLSTSSGPLLPAASPELSPQSCPSTEKCDVSIPKGSKQYFGFVATEGECGLEVKADNGGQAIRQDDIKQKGEQAVKDCEPKNEKKCGNGKIDVEEECDEGSNNGKGFCTEECQAELFSYCKKSLPPEIIFCKECLNYKNRFGINKDKKNNVGCSFIENNKLIFKPNGANCDLWPAGGAKPGAWDSTLQNSAFGICNNGLCVHDSNALTNGKTCSCNCNGRKIGWNEYCKETDELCAKQQGKISSLNKNICELNSKLVCNNKNGVERDINLARKNCEDAGKLFYSKVITKSIWAPPFIDIVHTECVCIDKPTECKK